jgi:hypothetical protein
MKTTPDQRHRWRTVIADYISEKKGAHLKFTLEVVDLLLDDADELAHLRAGLDELNRRRQNIHIGTKALSSEWVLWDDIQELLDMEVKR